MSVESNFVFTLVLFYLYVQGLDGKTRAAFSANEKQKPTIPWSHAFSRVFVLSSDRLNILFTSHICCYWPE